uniref:SCP domain-containing protein n=1 Tax=Leersia perrieri TaxID=77586 RepID=A0A0D9WQG3_9ORYZ
MATSVITYATALLLFLSITHLAQPQNAPHDFLQPHNEARAEVGVAKLSWDSALAAYARNYAKKRSSDCALKHSGGPYGENIYRGSAGGRRWTAADAVARWVRERSYYDCKSNTCAAWRRCGHYTQVTWARTAGLGCAAVTCDGGGTFVMCSYDPPANVRGRGPYPGCRDYVHVSIARHI